MHAYERSRASGWYGEEQLEPVDRYLDASTYSIATYSNRPRETTGKAPSKSQASCRTARTSRILNARLATLIFRGLC